MSYLLIGKISVLLFILSSCTEIEYGLDVEFVFINQSDYEISFPVRNDGSRTTFSLKSNESEKLEVRGSNGNKKNADPETCCQDVLTDVYGGRGLEGNSQLFVLNDTLCTTHLNEKSVVIENYSSEILGDNKFRFTYVFMNNDFENIEKCD